MLLPGTCAVGDAISLAGGTEVSIGIGTAVRTHVSANISVLVAGLAQSICVIGQFEGDSVIDAAILVGFWIGTTYNLVGLNVG